MNYLHAIWKNVDLQILNPKYNTLIRKLKRMIMTRYLKLKLSRKSRNYREQRTHQRKRWNVRLRKLQENTINDRLIPNKMTHLVLFKSTCMKTESKAKCIKYGSFTSNSTTKDASMQSFPSEIYAMVARNLQKTTVSQQPKTSHICNMYASESKQKTSIHNSTDLANNPEQISKDVAASSEDSSNSFKGCTLRLKLKKCFRTNQKIKYPRLF